MTGQDVLKKLEKLILIVTLPIPKKTNFLTDKVLTIINKYVTSKRKFQLLRNIQLMNIALHLLIGHVKFE